LAWLYKMAVYKHLTLHVEVQFQACSADQCQRPNRVRLDPPVKAEKHVEWHS
jgi:hypothetical protein